MLFLLDKYFSFWKPDKLSHACNFILIYNTTRKLSILLPVSLHEFDEKWRHSFSIFFFLNLRFTCYLLVAEWYPVILIHNWILTSKFSCLSFCLTLDTIGTRSQLYLQGFWVSRRRIPLPHHWRVFFCFKVGLWKFGPKLKMTW